MFVQVEVPSDNVNQLDTLQAIVILPRGIAAVVPEHAPDPDFGAVLVGAGDEARVRADLGCRVAIGSCRRRSCVGVCRGHDVEMVKSTRCEQFGGTSDCWRVGAWLVDGKTAEQELGCGVLQLVMVIDAVLVPLLGLCLWRVKIRCLVVMFLKLLVLESCCSRLRAITMPPRGIVPLSIHSSTSHALPPAPVDWLSFLVSLEL